MATIELLDEEIERKQQELQVILDDPNRSESEKAKAKNQAGESTLLNQIASMKQEALLSLAEGKEDIGNTLDALAALGAEDALKEISQAAEANGNDTVVKNADAAARESKNSEFYGKSQQSVQNNSLEAAKINQAVEDYYQDSFENLKKEEKAQVLLVVDLLLKDGYISLDDLFDEYYEDYMKGNKSQTNSEGKKKEIQQTGKLNNSSSRNNQLTQGAKKEEVVGGKDSPEDISLGRKTPGNNGGLAVFPRLRRREGKYAPLSVVAELLEYRYIFDDSKKEVTLSKGTKAYRMKANDKKLWRYPHKTETLQKIPVYENDLYLEEEDLLVWFGCRVFYLEKTNVGICLTEKMVEEAEEFYQQITEGEE